MLDVKEGALIARDQVMSMFMAASRSFAQPREQYVAGPEYEENLLYIDLAQFESFVPDLEAESESRSSEPGQ
jgi:hypothetical protein